MSRATTTSPPVAPTGSRAPEGPTVKPIPIDMAKGGLQITDHTQLWEWAKVVQGAPGFCPPSMKTVSQIFLAAQYGMSLGFDPMQAIRSIAVINGTPSLYGDGLRALILSHPEYQDVEEKIVGDGDDMKAVCTMTRKGHNPQTREFSMADAKRAGLLGKDNWKNYPTRMLQWRAFTWAARDLFADRLRGIQSAEEMADAVLSQIDLKGSTEIAHQAGVEGALARVAGFDPETGEEKPAVPAAPTLEELSIKRDTLRQKIRATWTKLAQGKREDFMAGADLLRIDLIDEINDAERLEKIYLLATSAASKGKARAKAETAAANEQGKLL